MSGTHSPGAEIGIVVPALDEADALPALLNDLAGLDIPHKVLVVDGGSADGTVEAAREGGAQVLRSRPGRARQLNSGAVFLGTPWLLMLHADSRLGQPALAAIAEHVRKGGPDAGYFDLAVSHPHFYYRLIEAGLRARVRRLGLVYGDQGLLVRRKLFFDVGPYPDEPVLEDVILNRRLLRAGRLQPLSATIRTSARRYEEEGRIRGVIRNATVVSRFLRGAAPAELAHRYPARRQAHPTVEARRYGDEGGRAMLLVFAKAPRPGKVKTRLAGSMGDEAAAAVYRRMGRSVVAQVAGAGASVTVCFDPPCAEDEVRGWLGDGPARYWPQPHGDLGRRMSRMFDRAFEVADRVVVIGTDAPSVDAAIVDRALAALDTADVVLGPAADGGYYLLGLRAPLPVLFTGVAWSTAAVLRQTAARARDAGATVTYLEVRSDIDTPDDLAAEAGPWLGSGL